jgi:flagellar protein FlaG
MIIQNLPQTNQAMQPDLRAHGAAPVAAARPVADAPVQAAPAQPSPAELDVAVAALNQAMQQSSQALEFSVDTDSHRTVVKMVDTSTGELLRQFPSEAALAISHVIDQLQQGMLLKEQA